MKWERFERLVRRQILTSLQLQDHLEESEKSGKYPEEVLLEAGIPRHEILFCLSEYSGLPFMEYDEGLVVSRKVLCKVDAARLRKALWVPLSADDAHAVVIAYEPSACLDREIKTALGVKSVEYMLALPSDISRIIDNSLDLNPGFPATAGRTPLAKVRTFLAERRSILASFRTSYAKGRTGLAFLRTGVSFITIAFLFARIFGMGYLSILEAGLLVAGIIMAVDGIKWYLPVRRRGSRLPECVHSESTWGTTVLEVCNPGDNPEFVRSPEVGAAEKLRQGWSSLTPVMRRRFLAGDRTDLAEERTTLAFHRTVMARARTGLAFSRTGIAFVGVGIGLLRQFGRGPWSAFDISLIITGLAMFLEGFYWYLPGRRAGALGLGMIRKAEGSVAIWDFIFPPVHSLRKPERTNPCKPPVGASHSPGIWATTGLALERTVLADRRNVMARLRTVMARSRTGMAFIRTGMSISAVGLGLLVYFGASNPAWTVFNASTALLGVGLIADGLIWHLPAERVRKQFPYCFADMEISIPQYGRPVREWGKAVFSHDDI